MNVARRLFYRFVLVRLSSEGARTTLLCMTNLVEKGLSCIGDGLLADAYPAPRRINDVSVVPGSDARKHGDVC